MQHQETVRSDISSSETKILRRDQDFFDKMTSPNKDVNCVEKEDDLDNLKYPEAWKYEKWFIGGYTQTRMLKFKKPKTMYTAINLFAGKDSKWSHE